MNLIELHILQSFPVSCLNRDDVGSPKTATFGGVSRARVSSQSLKRAARMRAREETDGFAGIRSRILIAPFVAALLKQGLAEEEAEEHAVKIAGELSKIDSKNKSLVTTAVYLSPGEIEQIATAVAQGEEPKKAVKKATRLDAADIALFGRMIANDATLNVEGAAMFSHALSTHAVANEVDFFSAVDDNKTGAEDAGAGMIGTLEYNAATYYRYVAINLDLFADETHLGNLESDKRRELLRAFLRATLMAVPSARKNSMNAATLPFEVLGIRKTGHPLQLVNAFEQPVKSRGKGLQEASREAMREHLEHLEKIWGSLGEQYWLTNEGLDKLLDKLLATDV